MSVWSDTFPTENVVALECIECSMSEAGLV